MNPQNASLVSIGFSFFVVIIAYMRIQFKDINMGCRCDGGWCRVHFSNLLISQISVFHFPAVHPNFLSNSPTSQLFNSSTFHSILQLFDSGAGSCRFV